MENWVQLSQDATHFLQELSKEHSSWIETVCLCKSINCRRHGCAVGSVNNGPYWFQAELLFSKQTSFLAERDCVVVVEDPPG